MKKVGHNSEFLFAIYWWTWKTTIYLKSCWSGPIKNVKILIFTILDFFKKNREKHLYKTPVLILCTKNLDDMICSSWNIECDILKLVIMGHFLPFYHSAPTWKIRILKKWKELLEISSLYICTKNHNHKVWFLRYRVRQTDFFCHFEPFFAYLAAWQFGKLKLWKNEKSIYKCHHFTHVYQKIRSHNVYPFWDMERGRQNFLSFWAIFCPFTLPAPSFNSPENQNVEKIKKPLGDIMYQMCTKNFDQMACSSWDIVRGRRTGRRKK